jgi:dTDP-4-dehydrorhamnose 3,5-epimerase
MQVEALQIPGPLLFTPERRGDDRGYFSETFRQDVFETHAGPFRFVQDNHSRSRQKGTIRGLHYQAPPHAQGKLVRATRGRVLDVVVDARVGSPCYGRHAWAELGEDDGRQLWAPPGFLHGFCTLTDDVEFLYKVTAYYDGPSDAAIAFDDPALGIDWPVAPADAHVSAKDRHAPPFAQMPPLFSWTGEVEAGA